MKIKIYYELSIYITEIEEQITVKDLINNFLKSKNLDEKDFIVLDDSNNVIPENKLIQINNKEINLYLVNKVNNIEIEDKKTNNTVEDIIMKVTNAKTKLQKNEKKNKLLLPTNQLSEIDENNNNNENENFIPDQLSLVRLNEMGFNINISREALIRYRNDIFAAINFLTNEN